jgi:hypothetical protein
VADEQPDLSKEEVERATSLLDIRRIIGSVLGIYGVLLVGAGVFGDHEVKNKAAGVNINLWVGLALLVACGVFWAWASTRPLVDELEGVDGSDVSEGEPEPPARAQPQRRHVAVAVQAETKPGPTRRTRRP